MSIKTDPCTHSTLAFFNALEVQGGPSISSDILYWYQCITIGRARHTILLARDLAQDLQLSKRETYLIGQAPLLHDIGKIAIPATMLNKPGPLTEQEWALMRRHPEIDFQMLRSVGGIWSAIAPLVLTHSVREEKAW